MEGGPLGLQGFADHQGRGALPDDQSGAVCVGGSSFRCGNPEIFLQEKRFLPGKGEEREGAVQGKRSQTFRSSGAVCAPKRSSFISLLSSSAGGAIDAQHFPCRGGDSSLAHRRGGPGPEKRSCGDLCTAYGALSCGCRLAGSQRCLRAGDTAYTK